MLAPVRCTPPIDDEPDAEEEPTLLDIDAPCVTGHEYRAEVPGVENSAFVLHNSHPGPGEMPPPRRETLPHWHGAIAVHGGYKHCFLAVDAATGRAPTIDMRNKKATGLALQYIICDWGLHKPGYKCTVSNTSSTPARGNQGIFISYAHQAAPSSKQFIKFPDKDIQSVVITRGYLQPQFPLGFKQQDDQTLGADDESDGGTPVSTRPTQHRRQTQHDPRKADDADPDDDDFYDGAPDQDRSNTGAPYDPSTSSDQPSSPGGNSSSTMIVWGWLVDLFLFKVRVKMKIKL